MHVCVCVCVCVCVRVCVWHCVRDTVEDSATVPLCPESGTGRALCPHIPFELPFSIFTYVSFHMSKETYADSATVLRVALGHHSRESGTVS